MYYVVKTGNLYVSGFCPIVGTPDIKKAVYWDDKNCAETIAVELGGVIVELKEPPRTEKEEKCQKTN